MSRYNLSLKVLYDGKAISQGTRTNTNDIRSLQRQAQQQVAQNRALESSNNSVARSYTSLATAVGGFMALNFAQQQVQNIGQIQLLNARLQGLTTSSQEYAQVQNYLIATSNKHNQVYSTMADSYSKLLTLRNSGIVTDTESKQLLEGMSNVASKLGADSTQLGQSLYGMAQGFSAGTLRAEELNQVTEPLPGLLQSLDKAAGLVSGGFRQMVVDGKVSSQFFKETLIKAFDDYEGAAQRIAGTIPAALNRTETAYEQLVNRIEQPVSAALVPTIDTVTSVLKELTTNQELVEDITTAATALAIVIGGRLASSLAASAAGFVQASIAEARLLQETVKRTAADVLSAKETVKRTAAEVASTQASLRKAQVTAKLTGSIIALTAAEANATKATLAHSAAEKNAIATKVAHAAAARNANITLRALSGTMRLLGGPAGLVMLAAWGIYEFAKSNEEATPKTKALADNVYDLSAAFDSLGNKKVTTQIRSNQNQINKYTVKIQEAYEKIAELKKQEESASTGRAASAYSRQIRSLESYIKNQAALRAELLNSNSELANFEANLGKVKFTAPTEPNKNPEQSSSDLSAFQKANASYQQRLALLGKNTELEKLNYEIASGKYAKLLPQQQQELRNLASLIDEKNKQADIEKDFTQLTEDLLTEEDRIRQSYTRRTEIARNALDEQGKDSARYAEIELQLRQQRDAALEKLESDKQAREIQRQNEARQREDQIRRDRYETEIAELQGFHSRIEAEEAAHEDRKRAVQLRYAGNYGQVVQQFVDFDRASGNDRVAIGLEIGENLAGQYATHSKKAFKVQQTLNIAKALMSTYTAAAAALELGPIAGPIAAGVITGLGLAQVKSIKDQKPPGFQYGGYTNSNKLIEIGERNTPELVELNGKHYLAGGNGGRVFNPSQMKAAGTPGTAAGATNVNVVIRLVEDASRAGTYEKTRSENGDEQINLFVADIRGGGPMSEVLERTYPNMQRTGT
ncbi:tape measure protein [uncultured Pseudoalteromonas sp.]|uniref:tape measure protein n=1 Tax=uncultured Pseudoalteromonas sp. TaxID=114053 RepID=UPI0030DBDED7|tara:strand:+ start:4085 stop:7024 length:2940 start_codon:yes stop_codon:yes gene_type:complete